MPRILVVDDDATIRKMVPQILADFETVTAATASEALKIFENGGRFDALLTDWEMPGMNGLELLAEVRRARPDLPAVIASGHAEELLSENPGIENERTIVLAKPYRGRVLIGAVIAVLAAATEPSR